MGGGPAGDASAGSSGPSAGDASEGGAIAAGDAASAQFVSSGDSSTLSLACQPGTYTGPFTTDVTSDTDAGGLVGLLASLFKYPWMGTLSITLQATTTGQGVGEDDYTMLTIAPGATISGTDQIGGHFSADVSGQLDCSTHTLTGTISNGVYEFPGDAGSLTMTGTLSATYGSDGGAPVLDGTLSAGSPQLQGIEANGTWTAQLQ